jgi:hypothetical protein
MVIDASIAGYTVKKILVDTGSSADILFSSAFDRMKLDRKLLQPIDIPLYGFGGTRVDALGKITLPVAFGDSDNKRTEYITFDVVDMYYPYNVIFERGFTNKFEALVHQAYLCMKMPSEKGIITVFGDQKLAQEIERGVTPGQKNIHCVDSSQAKSKPPPEPKRDKEKVPMAPIDETKRVLIDPADASKQVIIGNELYPSEEEALIKFLRNNSDVFAWSASDLQGVSQEVIQHSLNIDPKVRPKKQKLRKMSDEKAEAINSEVERLLQAGVIR